MLFSFTLPATDFVDPINFTVFTSGTTGGKVRVYLLGCFDFGSNVSANSYLALVFGFFIVLLCQKICFFLF